MNDITTRYCAGRFTRAEALDAVVALGRMFPAWWVRLRAEGQRHARLLPGAPDRATAAFYLRHKVGLLRAEAVRQKNGPAEDVLADRLAGLDPEVECPAATAHAARTDK